MEDKYFDKVISEMMPFIVENSFVSSQKGVYSNDKKSFKVDYNDERQMFTLCVADIDEDKNIGEYVEINAWLFDETQNESDAVSVGMDFVDVLKKNLGIKNKPRGAANVDLPTADSDKYTISTFTKKVLDTYPQLKDEYKNYVAKYGSFLFLNFYGEYLVPLMQDTINEKTKKSARKIVDLIEPAFLRGDTDSANAAIACISAVCVRDPSTTDTVMEIFSENLSLKNEISAFSSILKSNKKLRAVLVM